ncbi:MAG: caspase family protein [Nitrospirota bacterium]
MTRRTLRKALALVLQTSLVVMLSGCVMPPERRDPFVTLAKADTSYRNLTLGLVFSDNTKNAIQYAHKLYSGGLKNWVAPIAENTFQDIAAVFQRNFKTAIKIERAEDARTVGADLVAILDIYAKFPNSNFEGATIDVNTMFLKSDNEQIDLIRVKGVASLSLDMGMAIQNATDEVVNKLESALRGSVKLAELNTAKAEFMIAERPATPPGPAIPDSDVDHVRAVKVSAKKSAYAVVVGIEQYREKLPKADFADRDATLMGEYLTRVLGYPEENVIVRVNAKAAKTDLEKYFEGWLPNNVENDSSVFIYYSGHGAPNPKTGEAYLVPYDGDPTFVEKTGYPLKRLYAALDKLPAKDVTVVLDSCFSGAGGRSVLAQGAKPMVLSVENAIVAGGKTVVLSASAGDQISSAYSEKGHGLLTYFFLKGLQGEGDLNKDGTIDLAELYEYVKPRVQKVARKQFNNEQTPQLLASPDLLRKGVGRLVERAQ